MSFDWVGRLFTASMTVSSSILFFARCTCSSVMCSSPWRSASSALTRSRSRARRASPCSWAASAAISCSTPSAAVPFSNARRARRLPEFVLEVLDDGRLAGPRLPEDDHVARPLALERGDQDLRELSDVALSMRQAVRQVRGTQDFPVHLEDRPSAQVRLEDAFFHVIPRSP